MFNDVFNTCNLPYKATWGLSGDFVITYIRIEEMIKNNIPVILSFDKGNSDEGISIYYTDGANNFIESQKLSSHYVTITGIIEYSDAMANKIGHKRMLEVSSWGEKFYIDYDEYSTFMSPFTNILYIN